MQRTSRLDLALRTSSLALLAGCGSMLGAQTLPAAQPTVQAVAQPANAPPKPASRAQVDFAGGLLSIAAEDASLNQILSEIANRTGMRITGGVKDERVFGRYGPADVGTVLSKLLDGTGSNMLLMASSADRPQELVLTPRNGGPTPPSPVITPYPRSQDRQDERQGASRRFPRVGGQPAPASQTPASDIPGGASPAMPSATTTQQSPNGVKTPQQIYEELLRLQQQQQQKPAPPQ